MNYLKDIKSKKSEIKDLITFDCSEDPNLLELLNKGKF